MLWVNTTAKQCNAAFYRLSKDLSFEDKAEMKNTRVFQSYEPFPPKTLLKIVERASKIVHKASVWRALAFEKPGPLATRPKQFWAAASGFSSEEK